MPVDEIMADFEGTGGGAWMDSQEHLVNLDTNTQKFLRCVKSARAAAAVAVAVAVSVSAWSFADNQRSRGFSQLHQGNIRGRLQRWRWFTVG